MLHDAFVEVTCDGNRCHSSVYIELDFLYNDYSGKSGQYDHEDSKVEAKLIENFKWVVVPSDDDDEENKHYCNSGCVPFGADLSSV